MLTDAQEENPSESNVEDDNKSSIAVQANDYEIERRSGVLPARRRVIPAKFRYGNQIICFQKYFVYQV